MKYLLLFLGFTFASATLADDGMAILQKRCANCHDLSGPAAQSVQALWQRKGPDLFYAGSKYNREWLEKWLVKPRRIRPAGYHYIQHIKPGKKRDMIDAATLTPHPVLSSDKAEDVAEALMKLKAPAEMMGAAAFKGGSISVSFGEMVFDKFNGCMACHEIEPGYGGLSGPEVYTAAKRYQADYLVSFISSPQAWNPKTPMPNKHVAEPNIQKIVQYLQALAKENWDEKK
ncbi:MAG TPA: c-type cytochrome [Gammaproteobacteria bacterium]|nr:c-type cytochrome [Gammaproteobacteria bacterium]